MTRILIAEDDVEIAYLERDYLEMQGYQVDLVHDGGLVERTNSKKRIMLF
ncbi:TPA: hypothetical protein ACGO14_001170 [Streptococcus suis]